MKSVRKRVSILLVIAVLMSIFVVDYTMAEDESLKPKVTSVKVTNGGKKVTVRWAKDWNNEKYDDWQVRVSRCQYIYSRYQYKKGKKVKWSGWGYRGCEWVAKLTNTKAGEEFLVDKPKNLNKKIKLRASWTKGTVKDINNNKVRYITKKKGGLKYQWCYKPAYGIQFFKDGKYSDITVKMLYKKVKWEL